MSKSENRTVTDLPDFCLSCGVEYPGGKPGRCSHCGATPKSLRRFLKKQDEDDDGSDEYVEEYF